MCVLIFSTTFILNLSHSKKNGGRYNQKYTRYSCHILTNLNFLESFSKNIQIPNFMKIGPVVAELFPADRRTDRHDESNGRFSQFGECT